jgi:hypothetical protein
MLPPTKLPIIQQWSPVAVPPGVVAAACPVLNPAEGLQKRRAMKNFQTGQDFLQRMNLLLDNELTPDVEREVLEEIKTNPSYREMLSQEQSFREFIRSRIQRRKVSPSLVQSIKEKIHSTSNGRSI